MPLPKSTRLRLLPSLGGVLLLTVFRFIAFGQSSSETEIPTDDVIYFHVFKHVYKYQQIADRAESSGQSSPFRHSFRTRFALHVAEEQDLNMIASDWATQLAVVQEKIFAVRQAFRALHPVGILPKGSELPSPPSELAPLVAKKKGDNPRIS